MSFKQKGLVVVLTGKSESGDVVEVTRRGPGGLGVKGNSDRDAEGKGTTSGNRVNNGETLSLQFMDANNKPVPVIIKSVVLDRIVRDTKNFPDASDTNYTFMVGDKTIATGTLPIKADSTKGGPFSVDVDMSKPTTEFTITNGKPFHPIANRFRVSSVTISAVK